MRLKFLPSFVKRRGRITKKQEHSLRKLDNYSIKNLSEIISLSRAYECCTLEIGFGNSEYLQRQACLCKYSEFPNPISSVQHSYALERLIISLKFLME